MLRVLEEEGIKAIVLGPEDTRFASVETWEDAQKCAALFKQHKDEIDGVLVTLPNFGDERAVADTIRLSGLNVPVLVHAWPDDIDKMTVSERRDSFCGKMSVCNNLWQYDIPYSLTTLHTVSPDHASFREDLRRFAAVCRVAGGMRGIKIGVLGARPAAFITVRFSEKLLERAGISVVSLDLSEAFGQANSMKADGPSVQRKLNEIKAYVPAPGVTEEALLRMAKFGLVMERWVEANGLVATAVQCWTSLQEYFGIVPCTVMSMLSNSLAPSACETDVTGAIGMYAMQLATGKPSALLDWNNNYGEDPNKGVFFHCSNLPKDVFSDVKMTYQEIISGSVGVDNAYGTLDGRIKSAPFTYCRVSTDDVRGVIRAYVGEGELTDDPLETFGGYGVVHIPNFQSLLRHICENGYEHHVAINLSQCASAIQEAFSKYLGWEVYWHRA